MSEQHKFKATVFSHGEIPPWRTCEECGSAKDNPIHDLNGRSVKIDNPLPKICNCGIPKNLHIGEKRWCPHEPFTFFASEPEPELQSTSAEPENQFELCWHDIRRKDCLHCLRAENATLRELIRQVSSHGVATSYLTPELRAKLAAIAS